jgi:hypothetical protein
MEDDATRTPSPRSKSARPPAALFMEPKVPSSNGAQPETAIDPEPGPPREPERVPVREPEPDAPAVPAPRKASARKAPAARTAAAKAAPANETKAAQTHAKAAPARAATAPAKEPGAAPAKSAPRKAAKKAAPRVEQPVRPPWWTRTPTRTTAIPRYLAEAAVERYGDSAHRYVQWLRDTYPDATDDGLARAVVQLFGRRAGYTALAGPAGPLALLAAQARIVLYVAAAYGRDPRAPERAAELTRLVRPKPGPVLARLAGRILPAGSVLAGALTDAGELERTAHRAVAYYAPKSG